MTLLKTGKRCADASGYNLSRPVEELFEVRKIALKSQKEVGDCVRGTVMW